MNTLRIIIRRTYVLKTNGCGQRHRDLNVTGCASKMLQTFEECVFQRKNISSIECDNKIVHAKQYQIENKNNKAFNNYDQEYEEAVKTLNTLQSNTKSLRNSLHERKGLNSLQYTERYLIKSGLTVEDLAKLSYIHVSGTKGKGSTCALTDSILRSYGIKTGFFSSPHLVSVTERLRINGEPISKEKFTQYFWLVYNKLNSSQEYENDMPPYFQFLTILAFHIYLTEKVDVVILEVGIGGELDSTNIVPNTKTVGISSLGLEHTQTLGNTLKEIAWQKAGIIKPYATVYTSVTQEECLEVIKQRAEEKFAAVYRVPNFETYLEDPKAEQVKKQLNNYVVLNGSLALQLAYDWLRKNCNGCPKEYDINTAHLTPQAVAGILNCHWPGRCQRIKFFNFNIHLDGAHTVESMHVCGNWFAQATLISPLPKILIFNITGLRDAKKLLTILRCYSKFDLACFVPNIATMSSDGNRHDINSVSHTQFEQFKRAQMHFSYWQELCQESKEINTAKVFPCIEHCFQHIREIYDKSQDLNILVTGSIHLIGAAILSLNKVCT